MNTFSKLVRSRLAEKKISLRELCRRSGMDPSFLSKVLAGKRNPPSEDDLARLAGALDVSPAELFVSAGRLPREWGRLQIDRNLFENVRAALEGGGFPPSLETDTLIPPADRPRSMGTERASHMSEELL